MPAPCVIEAALEAGDAIELLTPLTLLVPRELRAEADAAALFAASGLPLPAEARIVEAVSADGEHVALMGIAEKGLLQIESLGRGEKAVRYTTPLLTDMAPGKEPTVWICDTGRLLYVKVCAPALQLAEVIAVESEADRSYLLQRLVERIDAKRSVLRLEDRAGNGRLYRNFFKKIVVCA